MRALERKMAFSQHCTGVAVDYIRCSDIVVDGQMDTTSLQLRPKLFMIRVLPNFYHPQVRDYSTSGLLRKRYFTRHVVVHEKSNTNLYIVFIPPLYWSMEKDDILIQLNRR